MGRKRIYKNNAARQRAYRLLRKQIRTLLAIPNPEPGTLPYAVQLAATRDHFRKAAKQGLAQAKMEIGEKP